MRIPLKLQYLICGRKRAGLLPIIEETSTNIYFPSPFANTTNTQNDTTNDTITTTNTTATSTNKTNTTNNHDDDDEDDADDESCIPAIYITGEPNHVSRVKDMLNKLAVQKVDVLLLDLPNTKKKLIFFFIFLTGKINVSQRYCTLCKKNGLALVT